MLRNVSFSSCFPLLAFFRIILFKNFIQDAIIVLNSLEPDQARTRSGFVGDDLDPNFFVKKKYQQTTLADKM